MASIKKQKYVKLDPIEHILKRPDMYIGSTKSKKSEQYVATKNQDNKYTIYKENITYSPGIERIFIEAISNACDNVVRSKGTKTPCTTIKVNINKETGETSVWNDGLVVPIEIHEEENIYNHTLIFSNLHAGENFDDDEERLVSGKNGLGIKTVNVFSSSFCVKGLDPKNKKTFSQQWKNNMKETSGPTISVTKLTKGYTEVTWIPDFKQFGIQKYTEDIIKLYTKLIIDIAMLTKVNVFLNDEKIPINTLTAYAQLYENASDEFLFIKTQECDVFLTSSTNDFQAISFVNGIYTQNNGVHVDVWCEELFRPLVDKFNGKKDKPTINIRDVKQFFRIFVCATVDKPIFDSQSKSKLESPQPTAEVKRTHITAICKWSSFSNIENIIKSKEMAVLKKSEKKKKNVKIEGYDPANNAGGKFSNECTLILCEGLSAKTYAVSGIDKGVYDKKGRDWFGVYPLRGKVLNVRNSSASVIAKNAVITDLIQILGLKHGIDYTEDKNFNSLNYGRVLLLTDADVDGIHIEGLLMNFFHTLFPSLLEREESFLVAMKTPIIRVFGTKGTQDKLFYDERKFNEFLSKQNKKVNAKYYKGLGTTKPTDVPDTFGLKMVEYVNDENTVENMNKVFHKKHTDDRKDWLGEYNPEVSTFSLDDQEQFCDMNISDFINGELIKFSHADCKRSIPSCMDGLKESQRKILYSVKKRKLKYSGQSLKVAQLAGYTAEHTNYHHGEQNLCDTIVKMANEFVGSNNIPLLYRDGMFGSRSCLGDDAASARYIFTKMDMLTEYIFREEDEPLLQLRNDDGDIVEPYFYIPIIPMVLVNGTMGIGSGWSSTVPSFNPLDIIECIKIWLENDGVVYLEEDDGNMFCAIPDILPWYRGFKGKIEQSTDNKYITYGVCQESTKNNVVVSEIPVNMSITKFKEHCEDLLSEKQIKDMKNYSTPNIPHFILTETNNVELDTKILKLHSYLYTSNMVLFDEKEQIHKFSTVQEIIDNFCKVRFDYYIRRKKYLIEQLEIELKYLGNKERFITEVVNKELNIMNIPEEEVNQELNNRGYDENPKKQDDDNAGYDYLLRMQVRTFTANKIKELKDDIKSNQQKLDNIKSTSEKQMWINELEEFAQKYNEWLTIIENEGKNTKKVAAKGKKK